MDKLTRQDLWSLEEYSQRRSQYRAEVIEHKKNRQVALGAHARLYFEDRATIRYQVQEMLRIEKIFEAEGIEEELDAYNPLIPDGSNWKATFMLEYDDPVERARVLQTLVGIEDRVWVKVGEHGRVFAIADEDLERENDTKTSAVHFLRFELSSDMVKDVADGVSVQMGIDHENYLIDSYTVPASIRQSLAADLAV